MKKIVFSLLFIITFIISSCSMSPDQMIKEFNNTIYEDVGGGIFETDGKPSISTSLIELPVYRIMEDGLKRIDASKDFLEYKWTLTDNSKKEDIVLSENFFTYIEAPQLHLSKEGNYTLTLVVTSRSNRKFMDTATIKVVDNIYN